MDFYSEMMSRNWAFISPKRQKKIRDTRILLAGCGLSSVIGVLAVQTGFTKFIVVDHDVVEVSNLNRQAFDTRHLGQNKALALKNILEEKSRVVEVEAYPVKITPENTEEFVSKADIVVNTVDFDEINYLIHDIAKTQRKPVFSPLNLGFVHGICLAFTPNCPALEELIGERIVDNDLRFFFALLNNLQEFELPSYMAENLNEMLEEIKQRGYNPQTGIGAVVVSAVVIDSIIRYLFNLPLDIVPVPMTIKKCFTLLRVTPAKVSFK